MNQVCTAKLAISEGSQFVKCFGKMIINTVHSLLHTVSTALLTVYHHSALLTARTKCSYTWSRWNTGCQELATVRVTNIDNLRSEIWRCESYLR